MQDYSKSWLSQVLVDTVPTQWQQLAAETLLADTLRAKAFGITPENVEQVIAARSHLLQEVYPAFSQLSQTTHQRTNLQTIQCLRLG